MRYPFNEIQTFLHCPVSDAILFFIFGFDGEIGHSDLLLVSEDILCNGIGAIMLSFMKRIHVLA